MAVKFVAATGIRDLRIVVEPVQLITPQPPTFVGFRLSLAYVIHVCYRTSANLIDMKRERPAGHREMGWRARSTELSKRLRSWRKVHKLSQSAAAIRLGMSRRTLQEWEQGRAIPHELVVDALHLLMARNTRRPGS